MRLLKKLQRLTANRINWFRLPAVARDVRQRKLTYLSASKLLSIAKTIRQIKSGNVQGDFVEYGVALGGSGICLAKELDGNRRFHGYDVFGKIPAPGVEDDEASRARYEVIRSGESKGIGGTLYYGYREGLYDAVCETFRAFGVPVDGSRVILHRGLFQDTVQFPLGTRIALAHIDCDWHDAVALCLERTVEVVSVGGFIILDDYNDYGGCRKATDCFLASHRQFELLRTEPHAILRRRAAG